MGVVDREFLRNINSEGLKKRIKYCRKTLCECILDFIENGMNDEHSGLPNRFGRMWHKDAVASEVATHARQIEAQQRGMDEAVKLYEDNGCPPGGLPAGTKEHIKMIPPTVKQWEDKYGKPMPEYSTAERIGWGIAGVAGAVVTVIAIASPFDGPAGDIVAGSATAAAWSRALGLGRAARLAY